MQQPETLWDLGGDDNSGKDGSPRFYRTDDGRFVVQGYKLTSEGARGQLIRCPDHEDAVIVTRALVDVIARHHAAGAAE